MTNFAPKYTGYTGDVLDSFRADQLVFEGRSV